MDTDVGFECVCPPGMMGNRCATPACGKDSRECSKSKFLRISSDFHFPFPRFWFILSNPLKFFRC